MVRVLVAEGFEAVRRARIFKTAPGAHIGQHNGFTGREDFCSLGHEFDPAKGNDIGVGGGGLARQVERVADKIGNVLDLRVLVIVGQDDGVSFPSKPVDLGLQVQRRVDRPDPAFKTAPDCDRARRGVVINTSGY